MATRKPARTIGRFNASANAAASGDFRNSAFGSMVFIDNALDHPAILTIAAAVSYGIRSSMISWLFQPVSWGTSASSSMSSRYTGPFAFREEVDLVLRSLVDCFVHAFDCMEVALNFQSGYLLAVFKAVVNRIL